MSCCGGGDRSSKQLDFENDPRRDHCPLTALAGGLTAIPYQDSQLKFISGTGSELLGRDSQEWLVCRRQHKGRSLRQDGPVVGVGAWAVQGAFNWVEVHTADLRESDCTGTKLNCGDGNTALLKLNLYSRFKERPSSFVFMQGGRACMAVVMPGSSAWNS